MPCQYSKSVIILVSSKGRVAVSFICHERRVHPYPGLTLCILTSFNHITIFFFIHSQLLNEMLLYSISTCWTGYFFLHVPNNHFGPLLEMNFFIKGQLIFRVIFAFMVPFFPDHIQFLSYVPIEYILSVS